MAEFWDKRQATGFYEPKMYQVTKSPDSKHELLWVNWYVAAVLMVLTFIIGHAVG